MNIQVKFFEKDFCKAIGAGIYKISIKHLNKEQALYIGESVSVLNRCAAHLYKLKKDYNYFGFTDEVMEIMENEEIILKFELLENCEKHRKQREKEYIQRIKPILQTGKSDWMKTIKGKREAVKEFLKV